MKLRLFRLLMCLGISMWTVGCASMFSSTQSQTQSPWKSFEEAQAAFDKILPGQTSTNQLKEIGFDPTSPNVKILTYLHIIAKFMPNQAITKTDLHPAVLACIEAKDKSHAYEVELGELQNKRYGNLMLDMTGFKRKSHETGWQFKALFLINDGVVVYKLASGEPQVSRYEKKIKPLGPLQEVDSALCGFFF